MTDRWRILAKRTNFGIPNEINAVQFRRVMDKTRGSLVARMELSATRSPEEAGRPRSQRLIECRRASQPVKEVGDTAPAEQHGHAGDELRAGGNDTRKIFVSQVSRASEVHF